MMCDKFGSIKAHNEGGNLKKSEIYIISYNEGKMNTGNQRMNDVLILLKWRAEQCLGHITKIQNLHFFGHGM